MKETTRNRFPMIKHKQLPDISVSQPKCELSKRSKQLSNLAGNWSDQAEFDQSKGGEVNQPCDVISKILN